MNAELNGLAEATYDELRGLARSYFRRERRDHTLQPTALVNEVYLRMASQNRTQWQSRTQLLGIAALMMRRVLREYARGRGPSRTVVRPVYVSSAPLTFRVEAARLTA